MNTLPRIAKSLSDFQNALFKPVDGGTYDGYIVRKLKNGVKLFALGETYVLNPHGVFCLATKQPDGRMWYSYGGNLNRLSMSALSDLADIVRGLALNSGQSR